MSEGRQQRDDSLFHYKHEWKDSAIQQYQIEIYSTIFKKAVWERQLSVT